MTTDEQIIEVLAKAQGIWSDEIKVMVPHYGGFPQWYGQIRSTKISECPDYLTSHDALHPVIDGLTIDQLERFDLLMNRIGYTPEAPTPLFWKATPRQKALALYKTLKGEG